jgi:ParB family transcriptional regulator, chromosome partitioning protein
MSSLELKGLKGLHSLDKLLHDSKEGLPKQNLTTLSVDALTPGKYQPRTDFDEASLAELAASIKVDGIIQPLIVRSLHAGRYEIIAGERRWRAAKLAELQEVPAIIRTVSDETALAFALIENIQRENLNPIDEAVSLVRLKDEFAMTHEDIATRVGRSRSAVTNLMRLLSLHDEVKELLRTRKIEMGHARSLLTLPEDQQIILAQKIVENELSVREAEKLVQKTKSSHQNHSKGPSYVSNEILSTWMKTLSEQLSTKVKINFNGKGEGRVVIHVDSPQEVEWLIETLQEKPTH